MNLTEVKKNDDSTVSLKLEFDSNETDSIRFEIYKDIKPRLRLNGFRKGHVPIQVAERTFGVEKLYGNKIRDIFNEELDKQNYEVFAIKSFDVNNDLNVTSEIIPIQFVEFSSDINSLYVVKEKKEPTDEEIDIAKRSIFKDYAERIDAPEGYESTKDDEVLVRVTTKDVDNDKILANEAPSRITLGLSLTELEQYLIGIKEGQTRSFRCIIHDNEYEYTIICDKIYNLKEPSEEEIFGKLNINPIVSEDEINDEISSLKNNGEFEDNFIDSKQIEKVKKEIKMKKSMDILLKDIRKELTKQKQSSDHSLLEALYNKLDSNSNFTLNEKMSDAFTSHIKSDVEKDLVKNILSKNYRSECLILSAAKSLNLKVKDNEIENEINNMKNKREIKDNYVNAKTRIEIRKKLLKKKAIDILIKKDQ